MSIIETVPVARPAYRPYRASVVAMHVLSPHFTRITFRGDDLVHFAPHAKDQRVKIVFPGVSRDSDTADDTDAYVLLGVDDEASRLAGDWYTRWRELPDAVRPPFRTYTARAVRQEVGEIDIDFVVHAGDAHDLGPAALWLADARVGDDLVIVGPDARSADSAVGMDWRPGTASHLLLVGDETAAPAICGILSTLPVGVHVTALIEVPVAADALPVRTAADADVRWLPRENQPIGALLAAELRAFVAREERLIAAAANPQRQDLEDIDVDVETLWDSPEAVSSGEFYAWIAGESAVIKSLRRFLVTESGVDRKRVAFMGYWRLGVAERTG